MVPALVARHLQSTGDLWEEIVGAGRRRRPCALRDGKGGDERGAEEMPRISPSRLHVGPNDRLKKLITH